MMVPVASLLSAHGGWNTVFVFVACTSMMAGVAAKLILAPMRRRWILNSARQSVILDSGSQPSPVVSHD
jgi:OFA family oxalate/formate antiporter-like MFS transporter